MGEGLKRCAGFPEQLEGTWWYQKCYLLHVPVALSTEISRSEYKAFTFMPEPVKKRWFSLMTLCFHWNPSLLGILGFTVTNTFPQRIYQQIKLCLQGNIFHLLVSVSSTNKTHNLLLNPTASRAFIHSFKHRVVSAMVLEIWWHRHVSAYLWRDETFRAST